MSERIKELILIRDNQFPSEEHPHAMEDISLGTLGVSGGKDSNRWLGIT